MGRPGSRGTHWGKAARDARDASRARPTPEAALNDTEWLALHSYWPSGEDFYYLDTEIQGFAGGLP